MQAGSAANATSSFVAEVWSPPTASVRLATTQKTNAIVPFVPVEWRG